MRFVTPVVVPSRARNAVTVPSQLRAALTVPAAPSFEVHQPSHYRWRVRFHELPGE